MCDNSFIQFISNCSLWSEANTITADFKIFSLKTDASDALVFFPIFPLHFNRENKYIPPGQRNREAGLSWGAGRQNSPRLVQCNPGPPTPRASPHDYNTLAGVDQRVVNGGMVTTVVMAWDI